MRKRLLTVAVVLLLALAGAGCGGGDDETSDADTFVTETTTEDTTTDETTTDETTDDLESLASSQCLELVNAAAAVGQALAAGTVDAEDVAAALEYAEPVPAEIRGDIELLAKALGEYGDAIRDLGIEPGETPSADDIQAAQRVAADAVEDPEIRAASERVVSWADANC
jgi:hypothetical protein